MKTKFDDAAHELGGEQIEYYVLKTNG